MLVREPNRRGARLALLSPYWSFFERSVSFDLRADRADLVRSATAVLSTVGEVVAAEVADSVESGRTAGAAIADASPDAVIVLQSMAVPPAYTLAALDQLDGVPLVVVATRRRDRVEDGFTHGDITTDGATVGTPQLTNVLHRRGRQHDLVTWRPGNDDRLIAAARSASAAARLRRARILRVGRPIPGYDSVDVDGDALLAATGISLVEVSAADVAAAMRSADGTSLMSEVEEDFDVKVEGDTYVRSVRAAAGLAAFDAAHEADAGAMNCHVPELRHGTDPGLAPCFALGRETSRGIPWTCSGDVITAVAMLAVKLLGGAALYHEIEALDHTTGEALLANTGEHDVGLLRAGERPELVRNRWWDGQDAVCGACALFTPTAGPATLVAFTPHHAEPSGFRFIAAEGEFTSRTFSETGTPNAGFRFAGDADVETVWLRWTRAGVNHHSAATHEHRAVEVEALAAHLGVGCQIVCQATRSHEL